MESINLNSSKVQAQLALCAAAVTGLAVAPKAEAVIVNTFSNTVIPIPSTTVGIYLNLETGVSGSSGSAVTGYDFNPYLANSGAQLGFYWGATATRGAGVGSSTTTGPYLDLTLGTAVGPTSTFTAAILGTTGSAYLQNGNHILGFRFINAAGATNYGYMTIQTTATTGFPATIRGWTFENSGAPIVVTAVPEPSTVALLALAGGAVGVRAWRRRQTA